jgi:AraC-like DNA-binding protein
MPTQDKISWIFDSEASTSAIGFKTKRLEIPYPPQLAKGYSEHHEILEGITLIQDKHEFISEDRPSIISMGNLKAEFSSSQLVIQITHSGCIDIKGDLYKTDSKLSPDSDFFSKVKYFEIEQSVITEENIFASLILVSEEILYNLLGSESADALFKNLNLLEISDTRKLYIPQRISNKIKYCIPDKLEGNMRSLYAQSMLCKYFTDLNIYIGSEKEFLTAIKLIDFDVDHLHSELLKVNTDIPTLSTLSKKYNVSPLIINQSFAQKYNQSIYSFLSNQGLEQARHALISTDISMKNLAHKIGFSHVNYFITAFKKRFGVTPGSIR